MPTLKFSQFTELAATAATTYIVGYDGTDNIRIEADDLNTTYTLSTSSLPSDAKIVLTDSNNNEDSVILAGGTAVTVSDIGGNTILIESSDSNLY